MRSGKHYFDGPLPRLIAHRGFAGPGADGSAAAVENTLPAFAAALSLGATHLETDVHASSDSIAMISHDPGLSRLVGREGTVSDFTADELRSIDLGGGVGFCSLSDALVAFPNARFNIDIKSADAVDPTIEAITANVATNRVLVTSFSGARRSRAVRALPGVATSASAVGFVVALLASKLGLVPVMRLALRGVDAVQVPEKALHLRVTTRRMIGHLHSIGVEMHVWTVDDRDDMSRLLDLGVDGIITDRADLAQSVWTSRLPAR